MARMMNLNDAAAQTNLDLSTSSTGTFYDPSGKPAYGSDGSKVGKVDSAILDSNSGKMRYLVVDTGGWFSSKQVLVPVGMARLEDDGVYFDGLTKQQVKDMRSYTVGDDVTEEDEAHNAGVLTGTTVPLLVGREAGSRMDYQDNAATAALFKAPQRLQLLEERLNITKTRERVGEVEVGKRVETHTEKVNVPLEREEIVIERHAVSGGQAVSGAVLGSNETIKVELEAERANVTKQAFVVEEVEIGKRVQTETQVVTETIGKEVLEVERNGQMVTDASGKTTTTTTGKAESLLDQAGNAVKNVVDNVTGNKR